MSKWALDTRGLMCPLPVIRTQDRVAELQPGDILEVISSDPGALNDVPTWCRLNGHEVVEMRDDGDQVVVRLVVGPVVGGAAES